MVAATFPYTRPVQESGDFPWWELWPRPTGGNPGRRGLARRRPTRGHGGYHKGLAGYVQVTCHSSGFFTADSYESLLNCCSRWRGGKPPRGFLPVGCGDREVCPECADYRATVQGEENARDMEAFIRAALPVVGGIEALPAVGMKMEVTVHKAISEAIKALGYAEPERFRSIMAYYGRQLEGLLPIYWPGIDKFGFHYSWHVAGETNPADPHMHQHLFVAGVGKVDDYVDLGDGRLEPAGHVWKAIKPWISDERREGGNAYWAQAQRKLARRLGVEIELEKSNVHVGYVTTRRRGGLERALGEMRTYVVYQDRALLKDLWTGTGDDGTYSWTKAYGREVEAAPESAGFAAERQWRISGGRLMASYRRELSQDGFNAAVDRVLALPKGWHRMGWKGFLAPAQRSATMAELGWEVEPKVEREDVDLGPEYVWRCVGRWDGGLVFERLWGGKGTGDLWQAAWDEIGNRPVAESGQRPIVSHRRGYRKRESVGAGGGVPPGGGGFQVPGGHRLVVAQAGPKG